MDQGPKKNVALERMQYIIRRGSPRFAGAVGAMRIVQLIDAWEPTGAIALEACKSPELAEGIVRLARSPLYEKAEIRSLEAAIEFLGYEELRRAMLTLAISAWAEECTVTGAYDPFAFRRRAVAHALLADTIAKRLNLEHPTDYFVAGMFSDVGYMFIALHIPFVIDHIALTKSRTPNVSLRECEERCLGFAHTDLSAVACKEFSLSEHITEAIRFHHEPSYAPEESKSIADVVHVSSYMLDRVDVLPVKSLPVAQADESAYARLGLDPSDLNVMETQVLQKAEVFTAAVRTSIAA
jgi:HD-like signal output (HDOD) protein